jgi:hypothetical protein
MLFNDFQDANCLSETKRTVKFRMKAITVSNRQQWISTCEELFSHSCLSLTQEVSQTDLHSTKENWGNVQDFESCGRSRSPWINCQLTGVRLDSIGSTSQNKIIWLKQISLSWITYRAIVLCQRQEKWNYPEIHPIISKDLQRSRFLTRGSEEFLFCCCSIYVHISSSG